MKKTALITGASSGFGKAMAEKFAANGWRLILIARREERLTELQNQLKTDVHIAKVDMTNAEDIQAFASDIPSSFADIDLLINNAGLALGLEPADKASLEEWQRMIDTNISGLVTMTRAILPNMVARKTGHIINLGSIAGDNPYPGGNVYGGTKAFVRQFSLNLRADLHGKGIRVSNLAPGLSETEFSVVRFNGDQAKADGLYAKTEPLRPEDIAETAFWIASLPTHININNIDIMPTVQAWGALPVHQSKV